MTPLLGLHHVTALAGDAQANLDYYRNIAGMRLIKRTVNYDDPAQHHFYYADREASLGSVLTFFPWGHAREARKGTGQAVAVAFMGRAAPSAAVRFGQSVSLAADPDGMTLETIAQNRSQHRLHSVTLSVADLENAEKALGELLQLQRVGQEDNRVRYAVGPDQFLDLLHHPGVEPGKMAAGSIHHVALRVGSEDSLNEWRTRLVDSGLRVTPIKDRNYFHSIYFRPRGLTLFELATESPGFTIDESADALGTRLCLPHWLEPHRAEIEGRLSQVQI